MNFDLMMSGIALAIRADGTYEPFSADAFAYVGQMMLLGMGAIFAVLAILWGVLTVFKFVFAEKPIKKTLVKEEPKAPEAQTTVVESVEEAPCSEADDGGDQLIAVITAAIAAYRAAEEPEAAATGFRVVSFRRVGGGNAWNTRK
ncbi:MAG: hypothetical protein E7641_00700 [Ruminococcaceae bacterium]|nr:hypothetical protein [Oscillospiraceae bacterium]